ncbi:YDG domain-containing protein, partial [Pelagibacteraceae bacterium]|nr:YDG domain-containing protein [Pelagibacteraceae bacterium]
LGSGSDIIVAGNLTAKEGGNINAEGDFLSFGGEVDVSGTNAGAINFNSSGEISLGGNLNASSTQNSGGAINIKSEYKIVQSYSSEINSLGNTNGGNILLSAPNIMSSGSVSAKGNQQGGYIDIESEGYIRLLSSKIDVAGNTQGGLVRIGGEFQGNNNLTRTEEQQNVFVDRWGERRSLTNAKTVLVSDGSSIDISSSNGKAGTAIIWSDQETTMLGNIDATGTTGGAVEISSKDTLRHVGLSNVNISEGGHLLLDPKNITVGTGVTSQNWIYRGLIGHDYVDTSLNGDVNEGNLEIDDNFGSDVSISDDATLMVVGARHGKGSSNQSSSSGEVYLYKFDDGDFTNATLMGRIGKGYTGGLNINISTIGKDDKFGRSVSFDSTGKRLAIGATGDDGYDGNYKNAGAVYLITFSDTSYAGGKHVGTIGAGYTGSNDVNLLSQGDNNAPVIEVSDLFGVSVALDGDADVLAVGSYGDHGYSEAGSEKADSGSVFMISLNSDFKGGEVKSRIGHGYSYNTGSDCYANSTCASFSQDFDTESETDLKLNIRDRLGWSVTLNHEGSLLAASRIFDDGKGNNATNAGAVNLFKFMKDGSVVSAETGTATYVGTIGYGYDYLDTSDISEHTVTLGSQDVLGKSVAFDKDADRLAVSFNDKSSEGGTTKPGGVHLYNLTDNLASATYVATIGDGYSGGKNVDLSAYMDTKDLFGDGVDLNETGSRLVVSSMLASGNSNTQSKSGEVMLIKFNDDAFSSGEIYGIVGSGYGASNSLDIDAQLDDNDQFGRGISFDRDGDRMAVTSTLDAGPNPANDYTGAGAVYLFTFSDTNFSNPTLKGRIGRGFAGDHDLDLGANYENNDRAWRVALDGDGDRLAFSQLRATSGGDATGSVYLVKFGNTDFENAEHVGTIGKSYPSTDPQNLSISTLDDGDLFTSVALTDDGSGLVVGAQRDDGFDGTATNTGAVYLITFSNTDFDNPNHVGTIGSGYAGDNDKNISSILDNEDNFGAHLGLTKDGKILAVGAHKDDGFDDDAADTGAVHLFTFGDNFSTPDYVASIGNDYDGNGGKDYDTSGISGFKAGQVAIDGDGNRLAIGHHDTDDVHVFGFQDTSLNGASLQFTIGLGQTGSNTLNATTHGLEDADEFPNSIAMDDTGTLMAVGATRDDGLSNGASDTGAVYLWSDTIMQGATSYTDFASDDVVINITELEEFLNNGVEVTLQANTDITISSAITVTGTGNLNLHAGRDVNINSNINTAADLEIIASDTNTNNVSDSDRDAGVGDVVASSASLTADDLTIKLLDGGTLTNASMGNINLSTVTATTGTLISDNFSISGASADDKTYDGTTSATVSGGTISGLNLTGTDLSLSSSGSFLTADVENNKEVPINYQLSGYTSGSITIEDSNGPLETVPLASILSGSQTPPLPGVAPDEEKEKIVVQEKINKDVFDDVSRIVSFISVDGASNAALIQNEFITSFPQVDALSIQRL